MIVTTKPVTDYLAGGEDTLAQDASPGKRLSEDQLASLQVLAQHRDKLPPERRALIESLAEQNKISLPPMEGFTDKPAHKMGPETLPMIGQLAGSVVGAMSPVPGAGSIIGGTIGALGGVKANDMLGISKPEGLDYLLSATAPGGGRLTGKAGRRGIPGASAAEQELAVESMRELPQMLEGSKGEVAAAYAKVKGVANKLPVQNFSFALKELEDTEQVAKKYGAGNPSLGRSVGKAQDTIAAQSGVMPLDEAQTLLRRYREKAASLESKGGEQFGAYKLLRKSLFKDMDDAVLSAQNNVGTNVTNRSLAGAVKELREAMDQAKKSIAKDEFAEVLASHGIRHTTVLGQTFEVIEPTKVLNRLEKIGFRDSVGPAQYDKIAKTLKDLAKIPHPDMAIHSGLGSEGRALTMTGAGIAGTVMGGPLGGAGTALATYGTMKIHDAIAAGFMSDGGRKFLTKVFRSNKGRMGEGTAQVLQFGLSQLQDQES